MSNDVINVFIGHPIGGDVKRNMALVERCCEIIFKERPQILPLAPYLMALMFLDDDNPDDRLRGVSYNFTYFARGFVDELWLFGDRITKGMWQEIGWARMFGIPVIPMTRGTQIDLIRREISIGSSVQIGCCGPGQEGIGIYHGEFMEEGRVIGLYIESLGRILDLYWGDICYIHPIDVPIHSPKYRLTA